MDKRNTKNEQGFTVMDVLGFIILVCFIVLIASYTRHQQVQVKATNNAVEATINATSSKTMPSSANNQTTPSTKVSTTQSTTTTTTQPTTTTPTPTPTNSTTTVINVSAADFSITVPNSIKDLTYHIAADSNGQIIVNFSTQTITDTVPACAANLGTGAFDSIERGNGQYTGPVNASSGALIKQYPTYYIAYILPQGPCATHLSPQNQTLLDSAAQDFYSSLSTVQTTQ
jgi:competence protein ComGC